ncbi:hypothetical protein C8J56DRAFT_817482 [Mycena floridula]|nr:hypothetical protein C8J56DRAFT_817482 [Mycena floridula]
MLRRGVLIQWRTFIHLSCPRSTQSRPAVGLKSAGQRVHPTSDDPLKLLTSLLTTTRNLMEVSNRVRASPILFDQFSTGGHVTRTVQAIAGISPTLGHQALLLAHALGCKVKQSAYECAVYHLAMATDWPLVQSTVSLGIEHTGKTTSRLLNWRIRALVEMENHTLLREVLGEFPKYDVKPNRRTFHLLISAFVRNKSLTETKDILVKMNDAGIPPDASTHALIAIYYRSFGLSVDVENHAIQTLNHVRTTTATAVLNSLLQIRIDAQDILGAVQLLFFFDRSRISSLISTIARVASVPLPEQASPPLLSPAIPNAATYSIFINYMASQADLAGAIAIFDGMTVNGVKPAANTLSSLVHAHFAAGRAATAVRMVADICDSKKSPLSHFTPLSSVDLATQKPLEISNIRPTSKVFNALLRGVLKTQGIDCVVHVMNIMRANQVKPNSVTVEIIISHLSKVQGAKPVQLIRLIRSFSSTLRPALRQLHVILSAVIRRERYLLFGQGWDTIAAPLSRSRRDLFRDRGVTDADQFSGFSTRLDPMGGIQLAVYDTTDTRPVLQYLSDRKIRSDGAILGLRMKRDAEIKGDIDTAKDVFQTLLVRGMQPNEYHFTALMEGFARAGNLRAASGVMTSARKAGLNPNVVMFTVLIVGYARQGKPAEAVRVFQEMVSAGIQPDVGSIDAVASAFFAIGAYATARLSLMTMWSYIGPFPESLQDASLKDLVRQFRLMYGTRQPQPSNAQQTVLYQKIREIVRTGKLLKTSRSSRERRTILRSSSPIGK